MALHIENIEIEPNYTNQGIGISFGKKVASISKEKLPFVFQENKFSQLS